MHTPCWALLWGSLLPVAVQGFLPGCGAGVAGGMVGLTLLPAGSTGRLPKFWRQPRIDVL